MRHPDPCYCEQAEAYEKLLREVLESNDVYNEPLLERIENTINEYVEASKEYADE